MSRFDARATNASLEGEQGRRTIVVIGLNAALLRTVVFKPPQRLIMGSVNRASAVGAGIGGKGQNVCVALSLLAAAGGGGNRTGGEVEVTLAHFAGGSSGDLVCSMLDGLGVNLVTSKTAAATRICTSLVDKGSGETTEIIEPWSGEISKEEAENLLAKCRSTFKQLPKVSGIAVMGSIPEGVDQNALVDIVDCLAESSGCATEKPPKILVDSMPGFKALADTGRIGLLKVNAAEVVSLAEMGSKESDYEAEESMWTQDRLSSAVSVLFDRYGAKLPWVAVTNGGLPSYLFSFDKWNHDGTFSSFWRIKPAPIKVVNPIGGGDATAAATLYEWTRGTPIPEAFRRGLSVAEASCVSLDPLCSSCFSVDEADSLLAEINLEEIGP